MTEAIFGLVGVLVGGLINGGTTWLADRRTQKGEGKVAARMVLSEIQLNNIHLQNAKKKGEASFIANHVQDREWTKHRMTLALLLDDQDWSCIEHYYLVLSQLIGISEALGVLKKDLSERNLIDVEHAHERGQAGREALRVLAGKDVTVVIPRSQQLDRGLE